MHILKHASSHVHVPTAWPGVESGAAWFCLCTQPKHEHIAGAHLEQDGQEIFLPRIRFKRPTRNGSTWATEALFPGYLFARFDLAECLRKVQYARGVRYVVHFGDHWPIVPDSVIHELRTAVGSEHIRVVPDSFQLGETVEITGGAMQGLSAVVTRVMPSQARVAVLLDFLGRQTTVEIDAAQLIVSNEIAPRKLCLATMA